MATNPNYVANIIDQSGLKGRLVSRKMFGDYGFHLDGKFVALTSDGSFHIKETAALAALNIDLPKRSPYPGAKPYPVADELLDNPALLQRVLLDTAALLPLPKARMSRKRSP